METLDIKATKRFGAQSPLRYPGGKAWLAGFFADLVSTLGIDSTVYVEPYAGGAGAAIALLQQGLVDRIHINDLDPAVHAFWHAVTTSAEEFVAAVHSAELSIPEWRRQREIYRNNKCPQSFDLGFAFFYLNRTNQSGVLNSGVIGGFAQTGSYKIDARFYRSTLADRIQRIGDLRDRITVSNLDGRAVIDQYANSVNTFMYIDPPYVKAGARLYKNDLKEKDHLDLASTITKIGSTSWLLTYDNDPLVVNLYQDYPHYLYSLPYSARRSGRFAELMVTSTRVESAFPALGLK